MERWSLPEFFDGSSISRNPRVYKEYRDFIISKYREDPARRLTFTEIRKSLVGDVGSLQKVFRFLNRWGLINFGAPPPPPPDGGVVVGGPAVVVEDGAPAGVQVVPTPAMSSLASAPAAGENGFKLPPLTSYSDVFGDWMPQRGPVCGACGDQFMPGQFESTKGGLVKCSKCSENKNNEEGKSTDDSKLKDQTDVGGNLVTSEWTDSETLLLLEAVLKHGDDWDLIAQHVRTKSKLDCIARLIQLPFGEHMLSTISGKCENKSSSSQAFDVKATKHALSELPQEPSETDGHHHMDTDDRVTGDSTPAHPSKRRCFPFVDATDSLMKQVALLSTVAGPHIAAAAAEAAVTALCNENPYAGKVLDIDEDEVTNKVGLSLINNEQERESDIKVEDWDMERHKQTDTSESIPEKNFAAMTFRIRAAIATAMGASAARAKLLADQEEREIEHLMASIIETQMRKVQYKIKHFEELELIMEKEYTHIQQLKESILEDWVSVLRQAFHAGIPRWRDHGFPRSLFNSILGE